MGSGEHVKKITLTLTLAASEQEVTFTVGITFFCKNVDLECTRVIETGIQAAVVAPADNFNGLLGLELY